MEQPSVARRWRWWYQLALFIAMGGLFISTAQRTGVRMAIAQPTGRAAPESDVDNRVRLVAKSREERADVVRVVEAWGLLVGSRIQLPNPITPLSHAMLKKWLDEWRRKVLSLDEFQGPLSGDRVTLSGEEQELLDLLRDMRRHSILFDRGAASFSDRVAGFRAWLYQSPDFPMTVVPSAQQELWNKLDREPYDRTLRRLQDWFDNEVRQIPPAAQRESQLENRITLFLNELQTEVGERNQLCCGAIPTGADASARKAAFSKFIRLLHDTRQQLAAKGCLSADRLGKEKLDELPAIERALYRYLSEAALHNPVFRDLETHVASSDLVVRHYEHLRVGRPQPEASAFQTLTDLLEVEAGIKMAVTASSSAAGSASPSPLHPNAEKPDRIVKPAGVRSSADATSRVISPPIVPVDSAPTSISRWWLVVGVGACCLLLFRLRKGEKN